MIILNVYTCPIEIAQNIWTCFSVWLLVFVLGWWCAGRLLSRPSHWRQWWEHPHLGKEGEHPYQVKNREHPHLGKEGEHPYLVKNREHPHPVKERRTPSSGQRRRTPSSGQRQRTPSFRQRRRTPSSGQRQWTPSSRQRRRTSSSGQKQRTPPSRQRKRTSPSRQWSTMFNLISISFIEYLRYRQIINFIFHIFFIETNYLNECMFKFVYMSGLIDLTEILHIDYQNIRN